MLIQAARWNAVLVENSCEVNSLAIEDGDCILEIRAGSEFKEKHTMKNAVELLVSHYENLHRAAHQATGRILPQISSAELSGLLKSMDDAEAESMMSDLLAAETERDQDLRLVLDLEFKAGSTEAGAADLPSTNDRIDSENR